MTTYGNSLYIGSGSVDCHCMVWGDLFGGLTMRDYSLSIWEVLVIMYKDVWSYFLVAIILTIIGVKLICDYNRKVQQREAEEEARMKATLSPEDFNQWLLRREIRRAGNNIASSINALNANMWNKKGN